MAQKEAKARIKINKLLDESGWRLLDGPRGEANVVFENHVKITETHINAWGKTRKQVKR